jgi:hypothetical protein
MADDNRSFDVLTGPKLALYQALNEVHESLASMYLGAFFAYQQTENPDRLALVSHAYREIMEKLTRHKNVPIVINKADSLTTKVRTLQKSWEQIAKTQVAQPEGNASSIDALEMTKLTKFLKASRDFFDWVATHRPTRKKQVESIIRGLDPAGRTLPKPIEKLRVAEWDRCHSYFELVSLHSLDTTLQEFDEWTRVLDGFLLERLRPRTFVDRETIRSIIQEGESSD